MASPSVKPAPPPSKRTPAPASARRAPRRKRGLAVLAVGLLLIAFAPSVIALSPLRDLPLRMVFEGIGGTIRSEGASLGWFSGVEYRGVQIHDDEGTLLLHAPAVTVDRTPLQLLSDRSRVGKVVVHQPKLHIIATANGSNAEDVILPWWNTPSSGPVELELEVIEGAIAIDDKVTHERWNVAALEASMQLVRDQTTPISWSVGGKVENQESSGQFTASSLADRSGAVQVKTEQVPLGIVRWLLARSYPDLKLSGDLACELSWQPSDSPSDLKDPALDGAQRRSIRGQIGINDLVASGGPLKADELRIKDLIAKSDIELTHEKLHVKQLAVDCDVGRLTMQGDLTTVVVQQQSMLSAWARDQYTVDGTIDLARLAQMLPKTLRVRPETQITAGALQWKLASQGSPGRHTWEARLETRGLTATNGGQPIRWEKPIVVDIAARETDAGIAVDALECSSDFLHLSGKGTADELTAEVAFDLDELKARLGPLVELGDLQLAGDGQGKLHWQLDKSGAFRATGSAHLKNFQFGPSAATWREEDLTVELQAGGSMKGTDLESLDSAVLQVAAAGQRGSRDQLDVHLREPVVPAASDKHVSFDRLPLLVHCRGNLVAWRTRLSPWIDLNSWDTAGTVEAHANLTWTPSQSELHSLQGAVQQLKASKGHWFIDEPIAQFNLAGRYDPAARRAELTGATIESSTASVKTDKIAITTPPDGPPEVSGKMAFVADVEKVQRWIDDPKAPAAILWRGQLAGQADLVLSDGKNEARIDATIDNLAALAPSPIAPGAGPTNPLRAPAGGSAVNPAAATLKPLWQEKQLTVGLRGSYSRSNDIVRLDEMHIESEAIKLRAIGQIGALAGKADLNMQGQVDYDWSRLSKLLMPYLGNDFNITGRETRQFAVRGPIGALLNGSDGSKAAYVSVNPVSPVANKSADTLAWVMPLSAQTSIGWQQADILGMRVGQGELNADLSSGVLKINPVELQVSEGRVRLAPEVLLSPTPAALNHGRGKLIERVRVSPEMAASWLKYIAPAVAEATQTEGQLSLDLEGAKVPLFKPEAAEAAGRLEIHSLQVTPGAPARTLILLAEQIRALVERRPPPSQLGRNPTLLSIGQQQINFRMADGRVHHQGMTMNIGDVTIRTQGWVALDESISLVAEVPIKPEWAPRDRLLASLKDKTLQIPIGGTLRQPRVDPRAIQEVASLFVQNAARDMIQDQLNKQLDRLFQPR